MDNTITELKEFKYCDFWRRVSASLLDCIFLIPVFVVYFIFQKRIFQEKIIWAYALYVFTMYFYRIFFIVRFGGTLGTLVRKMKVVNTEGGRIHTKAGNFKGEY